MNTTIIHKNSVNEAALEALASLLPAIIASELDVPGGNVAPLKADQVDMHFSPAGRHDRGADIRLMIFARKNEIRKNSDHERARKILARMKSLPGIDSLTTDVRLYLMEVGSAGER